MMTKRQSIWEIGAGLALVLILVWPGATRADGGAPSKGTAPAAPVSEYALFVAELQAAGALQFYETTEDLVRLGQFDRALMRYRFLAGQIAGLADCYPVAVQVQRRLEFLREQLKLASWEVAPIAPRKLPRVVKKPEAPPAPKPSPPPAEKPKPQEQEETPAPLAAPPAPPVAPPPAGAAPPASPPGSGTGAPPAPGMSKEAPAAGPPANVEKGAASKEAPQEDKAPPPAPRRLSMWEKLMYLLPWGKKGGE